MAHRSLGKLIQHLRTLGDAAFADQSDAQLLGRFAAQRDEGAFAALLERHGPMVFGVCRRVLRHEQDAEDAFQATFLVLARKAGSRGWRDSVGAWLYAAAQRVALKARTLTARRRARHTEMVDDVAAEPARESPWRELRPILDEELNRLPEKYRTPLVLCYLEGKTNEEAARQLGRPVGTVWYQLSRGRELLRGRLSRRGVALSAATLAAALAENASAAVSETLLDSTMRVVMGPLAAGTLTAPVAVLVKGVLHDMLLTKLKMAVAALAILCVAGLGAGAVVYRAPAVAEPNPPPDNLTANAVAAKAPAPKPKASGKTEPPGAPLEARLIAKKDTYVLDRGGKTEKEYAEERAQGGRNYRGDAPPSPEVDLALEVKNTSDKDVKLWIMDEYKDQKHQVGGDYVELKLQLEGPGASHVLVADIDKAPATPGPRVMTLAPGKVWTLPISSLSFGRPGVAHMTIHRAYWTKPGDYTLTATYKTAVSPAPKGATRFTSGVATKLTGGDNFRDFGAVSVTSAPIKLKVVDRKPAAAEPKAKESGKTEPPGAPLEARLVAKQKTYTLDRGGKSAEDYAKQVRDAARAGDPLPTPRVELTLELRNTGDKEIKILVGGDGSDVMLDLRGPGAVTVRPNMFTTTDYRASDVVAIAPGKSHVLTLSNLSFGHRGVSDLAYWTKPGEYTLTATYHTAVSPRPKGSQKAPSFLPDFGHVAATSAPIKLKVIEKK